jgi:tRNA threonylcarbamoyladenosine biosynthesis protein TsaB
MVVLAIDTCDARGSIALLRDDRVLALQLHESQEDYSSWLLPAVRNLLDTAQVSFPHLSLYAVASGPGSFTGVRVGLTTVKAWSEVYGQRIAAVSRLEALATYTSWRSPLIAVFTDAHRNQLFGALYRREADGLQRLEDELVIAPDKFMDWIIGCAGAQRVEWISPDPKCITATPQWPSRMALAETIRVVAPNFAPAVGQVALRLARQDKVVDALTLDANYVRRSDAELLWKGALGGVGFSLRRP